MTKKYHKEFLEFRIQYFMARGYSYEEARKKALGE